MKRRGNPRKKNDMLPAILIGVGALLVISVLFLQIFQSPNIETAGQDIPEPDIKRVTLTEAKAAFDGQSAVFLDVRDAGSYASGHIPKSINIPYAELESRVSELDSNQWIITYCT